MKVAVVGAGVMGCATAWALQERGADVIVHEQFELDHARGSSHGRSRIFRVSYPEASWIRLAQEAYAEWRDLERAAGGGPSTNPAECASKRSDALRRGRARPPALSG